MSFSISEIKKAKERIAPYIIETPLLRMPNLDSYLGCQVYVKAECMQTTGAFKLRGAMNKTLMLSEEQRKIGVVSASSGNHGRGMAYAAKTLGGKATIVMPRTAPKLKIEAIKALGAEVVLCDISERFEIAEKIQKETGAAYLFIAHDLSMVKYISDRIGVLHLGHLVETGTTEEIFANPVHPYTRSLISAIPHPNPAVERKRTSMHYDYFTSGIDYMAGTLRTVEGTHKVLATEEEFEKWTKAEKNYR